MLETAWLPKVSETVNRFLRLALVVPLALALLTFPASAATASSPALSVSVPVAAGVIAKPKPGVTMGAASFAAGQQGEVLADGSAVTYPTPAGESAQDYAAALKATGRFEYVSPNYVRTVSDYTATPDDPDFNDPTSYMTASSPGVAHAKSWALRGTGSADFDKVWPDLVVNGQAYHARATGDAVPIAVLDTGFYSDQSDRGSIVAKKDCFGTYSGATGVMTTDSDVTPVSSSAPLASPTIVAHGTMTASEIAEAGNNGAGTVGATYDGTVWVYKVQGIWTDGDGSGAYPAGCAVILDSAIIDAIRSATDDGAKVISMSLGGADYDPAMQDAIDYAASRGVVVVAAAGNTGAGGSVQYPAAYNNVIGVGSYSLAGGPPATTPVRSSFSAYGNGLDILAPGDYIWGPDQPGYTGANSNVPGYCWWQGTSMSAPFVAAAASLLLRFEPSLSPAQVETLLESSATSMGAAGYSTDYGWGRLDMQAAYEKLVATYPMLPKPTLSGISAGASYTDHDFGLSWTPVVGENVSYVVSGDWNGAPLYSGSNTSVVLSGVPDGVHTVSVTPQSPTNWSDAGSVGSVTFGVNASPPAQSVTILSLGTSAQAVTSGQTLILSGSLMTGDGAAVAGNVVSLSRSPDGGATWQELGTAQTDPTGAWSFTDEPDRGYLYKAIYYGDSLHLSSASSPIAVAVAGSTPPVAAITIGVGRQVARRGQTVALFGHAAPSETAGLRITVYVKKPGRKYWTYSSNRVVYASSGRAAWQYAYRFKPRTAKGTYQFRAVWVDGATLATLSRVVHVRVK